MQRKRAAERGYVCVALRALLACCVASIPSAAEAAGGGKTPRVGQSAAFAVALQSGDPARVDAALDVLGERGDRDAVDLLTEFLHQGQPDPWTDRALRALGKTRSRDALLTLAEFARHRRVSARQAAYDASAHIGGESANELLAQGLRDSDPGVRGLCAHSLGERGAKSQLEVLFRALERGVPEASSAIGRLGDATAVTRLHTHLGHLPIQVVLGGYEQFLQRDELAEDVKLEIVARLGEVAGLTVKRFLERMLASKSAARQPRLLHALSATAKRIDDRPKPKGLKP